MLIKAEADFSKVGDALLFISEDKMWKNWLNCVNNFSADLFSEGREQPFDTDRDWS
jgi:hypothetical protein